MIKSLTLSENDDGYLLKTPVMKRKLTLIVEKREFKILTPDVG